MKRILTSCGLIIISLSLVTCGFSLRGNELINSRFNNLQLSLSQPNSEFSRMLRRSLDAAEVSTEVISTSGEMGLA